MLKPFIPRFSISSLAILFSLAAILFPNHAAWALTTQRVDTPVFESTAHVEIYGNQERPPVILLHGLGENGCKDWSSLIAELESDFYVITFDLPGFGRSDKTNEFFSPEKYSKFIDFIRSKYIAGKFTLIGHSMGGSISLDYAANYPENVERLVLVDAAGILHRNAYSRHFLDDFRPNWWSNLIPKTSQVEQKLGKTMEDFNIPPWMLNYAVQTPVLREKFFRGNPMLIAAFSLIQHNYSNLPESINCPTKIIWGADDTIAPVRTAHLLNKRIRDSRLEIIPSCGHVPMSQVEGKFNDIILNELFTPVEDLHPKPKVRRSRPKDRVVITGPEAQHYSGRCKELIIKDADQVVVENAEIGMLIVSNSTVQFTNCEVGRADKGLAMTLIQSQVMATAVDVLSEKAIYASESKLDFAGVHFVGKQVVFDGDPTSQGVFSICMKNTLSDPTPIHGVLKVKSL